MFLTITRGKIKIRPYVYTWLHSFRHADIYLHSMPMAWVMMMMMVIIIIIIIIIKFKHYVIICSCLKAVHRSELFAAERAGKSVLC